MCGGGARLELYHVAVLLLATIPPVKLRTTDSSSQTRTLSAIAASSARKALMSCRSQELHGLGVARLRGGSQNMQANGPKAGKGVQPGSRTALQPENWGTRASSVASMKSATIDLAHEASPEELDVLDAQEQAREAEEQRKQLLFEVELEKFSPSGRLRRRSRRD